MSAEDTGGRSVHARRWLRIAVLALFALVLVLFFALGGPRYLTLDTIKANRAVLVELTGTHYAAALALAFFVYVLTVTFSLPGAAVLSLTAGFLFGRWIGLVLTVGAATLGATLVFLGARYVFADVARRRLGRVYERMHDGFARHGFNYLLFLRLVPLFPFFLVNLAPAIADMRLSTYVVATAIGIIPGSFVFVNLGEALGRIESTRDLVAPGTLAAFGLLGVLALLPVLWRKRRTRPASGVSET